MKNQTSEGDLYLMVSYAILVSAGEVGATLLSGGC